jgi:hypothetical protein
MSVKDILLLQFEGMPDGTSLAGERCPACGGGSTEEGSLSVSKREGLLLWKCHRASCGFAGATSSSGQSYQRAKKPPVETRATIGRWIASESSVVGHDARQLLASKYGITDQHIAKFGIGWDDASGRLAIPVTDIRSERLGVVLRSLDGSQPKSLTHAEKDAISWFVNPTTPDIIIVEDQFSAIRASDYLTSVALLGTHLNEERVREIRAAAGRHRVYLALDADAFSKSVGYAIKYRQQLSPILVKLEKDIKDLENQELSKLIASLSEPDGL